MAVNKVFVYGTLRRGERNHGLLADADPVAEQARITGKLIDTGYGYPACMEGRNDVYGELYEVNDKTLSLLDTLEGFREDRKNGNLFHRVIKNVITEQGECEAYVYLFNEVNYQDHMEPVPFADWRISQWYKKFENAEYFAFGSCMDTERIEIAGMLQYFLENVRPGILKGYEFTFGFRHPGGDGSRADIKEARDDDTVEGVVYSLPRKAVDYLFKREGVYRNNYRPVLVDVETDGTIIKDALTFTVIDKQPCIAPPVHYVTEILRGAEGRLSGNYCSYLKKKLVGLNYEGDLE